MAYPLKIAVLGAGGLGRGMVCRVSKTPDFKVTAIVDRGAYIFEPLGITSESIENYVQLQQHPEAIISSDAIMELLNRHADDIDTIFVALPNLPVDFIPGIVKQIALNTPFRGVMVDALKRTKAVELMLDIDEHCRQNNILYITGAGATPGFLSTVAAVAAQSFVEVTNVDIRFGVGISNWNAYRSTIREDFIHLDGFDAEQAAAMSDAEIEAELEKRNGILELNNMEHADDIILERAGICRRDQVTVGGIVDTRNAKKPVSTQVTITGKTVDGVEASHVLTLDNATTMIDNVCGPALGFIREGYRKYRQNCHGILTSADLMPRGGLQTRSLVSV